MRPLISTSWRCITAWSSFAAERRINQPVAKPIANAAARYAAI
jgi:hypothetical protein